MTTNARDRCHGRAAFTLVECLVVIGVMGLLVALLIPAVQSAREGARRAQCLNNLHQIAIGVSSYASAAGCLPMAQGNRGASPLVSILPFIEQQTLHDAMNFEASQWTISLSDSAVANLRLSTFLCPSESAVGSDNGDAWTSYAGNRGVGTQRFGENGSFSFPPGTTVSFSGFTDGTSNTSMFTEWVLGNGPTRDRDPLRATFRTATALTEPEEFDRFADACRQLDPTSAGLSNKRKGSNWLHGEFGMSLYNHTLGLNEHSCLNGSGYQVGAWTAGSRHPGSVNTLFADGSARPVRQTIAVAVWRALGSRNGHEVVSSGDQF